MSQERLPFCLPLAGGSPIWTHFAFRGETSVCPGGEWSKAVADRLRGERASHTGDLGHEYASGLVDDDGASASVTCRNLCSAEDFSLVLTVGLAWSLRRTTLRIGTSLSCASSARMLRAFGMLASRRSPMGGGAYRVGVGVQIGNGHSEWGHLETRSTAMRGAGLGCRSQQYHGGSISIHGERGHGTIGWLFLVAGTRRYSAHRQVGDELSRIPRRLVGLSQAARAAGSSRAA